MAQKIILDTDIGDDVDDALALGLILASEELELVGVTTVYKNTAARARQARTILQVAGRPGVPVAAGCGAVLSTRVPGDGSRQGGDARRGYLDGELPNQDGSCLPEAELPPLQPKHGVDFLIDALLTGSGDIIPVTIGAMTNLAMAITKEPRIIARIPRIVSMAAAFDRLGAEWNIACDPMAANILFESGIPMQIVGLDVTMKVQFRPEHIEALRASPRPLTARLAMAIQLWQKGDPNASQIHALPIMHDPLAVATLLAPRLVRWRRGKASVEMGGGDTYGFTTFREDPRGRHQHAYEVDAEAALALWMGRVLAH